MDDHRENGFVPEADVLLFKWGKCIVADGIEDEFLACLFHLEVAGVALNSHLVHGDELFTLHRRGTGNQCRCRVSSWVVGYRVRPLQIGDDDTVFRFRDGRELVGGCVPPAMTGSRQRRERVTLTTAAKTNTSTGVSGVRIGQIPGMGDGGDRGATVTTMTTSRRADRISPR